MRPGISRELDRVLRDVERLDRLAVMSLEEILAKDLGPFLEREVEVVIQGLRDLGEYIIAAMGWEPPSRYSEIGRILANHGVLGREEGGILSDMARLRNVLVHVYADIDYELLLEHARALRVDARILLEKMLGFIEEQGLDP